MAAHQVKDCKLSAIAASRKCVSLFMPRV
jgi:hypothetical protein